VEKPKDALRADPVYRRGSISEVGTAQWCAPLFPRSGF
jgi:hypothetical protein